MAFLQAATSTADLSTYTFSSQNLGSEYSGRYIVLAIGCRRGSNVPTTIDSVTIAGVNGTIVAQDTSGQSGGTNTIGFAVAFVPAGTTGDIVITFSSAQLRCVVQIYSENLSSATAYDVDIGGSVNMELDVPDNGLILAACINSSPTTMAWTGVDEDYDAVTETFFTSASARREFESAQTAYAVSVDLSGSHITTAAASFTLSSGGEDSPILPIFIHNMRQQGIL